MSRSVGHVIGVGLVFGAFTLSSAARATWSIVAVDPETREVGIAGATCGPMVWFIGGLAPGQGAMVTQYATWGKGRRMAVDALDAGDRAEVVLQRLRAEDRKDEIRQYGIVSLDGGVAQFTGTEVEAVTGLRSGETWAVQGNTLASPRVVEAAAAEMESGEGPLVERLLNALVAGADEGGDQRCDPEDAARSAFLYVARPGDEPHEPHFEFRASGPGAVEELAMDYAASNTACSQARLDRDAPLWLMGLGGLALFARRRPAGTRPD